MEENIYIQNGFANRREYQQSLCDEYGRDAVIAVTSALPASEDFDGLVTMLEDYADMIDE